MATYLNTKQVLDRMFSRIRDNSAALRVKALSWLNSLMQEVVNEPRDWVFLHKTVSIAIVNGAITLPADFRTETFIQAGVYLFTQSDRLTDADAAELDETGGEPVGYTLDATTLTFHPAATGTASLHYTAMFPAAGYEDNTNDTLFPSEWLPAFERALLAAYFEYDVDTDRLPLALQISEQHMRTMKVLDNQRKAIPQMNSKGFVRV